MVNTQVLFVEHILFSEEGSSLFFNPLLCRGNAIYVPWYPAFVDEPAQRCTETSAKKYMWYVCHALIS